MSQEPIPEIVPPRPPIPPLPNNEVHGTSSSSAGVLGESNTGPGVSGRSVIYGDGTIPPIQNTVGGNSDGVLGESGGIGVHGIGSVGVWGEDGGRNGVGVKGTSKGGNGIWGESNENNGVIGISHSATNPGVYGESDGYEGVRGVSNSPNHGGVVGICSKPGGTGVFGTGPGRGVWGLSTGNDYGVVGNSVGGIGVIGTSENAEGMHGETNSLTTGAVAGISLNPDGTGAGLYGESRGKGPAGFFKGDVFVTGDIRLQNQDCAEDFDISEPERIEPGTVMVIDQEGSLRPSQQAYDRRVAGVVSGAGNHRPGIILGRHQVQENKIPLALVGKVYCKVDAAYSTIDVGDLLTTSLTPGHAMKAEDHIKAFGAMIGKALNRLEGGQGLIPILVAFQ
jgi:hypothetical protein